MKPKTRSKAAGTSPATLQADWRHQTLAKMRALILQADPEMIEEVKWRKPSNGMAGVPVWSHGGMVCTGETYAKVVKLTFAKGAKLPDPARLFNASLEGNARRAIDLREGEMVDARAFKALIQAAVTENLRGSAGKSRPEAKAGAAKPEGPIKREAKALPTAKARPAANKRQASARQKAERGVILLSGGNPQIAKGEGDAPVQQYLAAMPGWKHELGQRLDALIVGCVPKVRKAVKWNSPFYGVEGEGWFLSFHVFTRYVKVTFFCGASLRPLPPGGTERSKDARWIDLHEGEFDEAQLARWVKQAAKLPGWMA